MKLKRVLFQIIACILLITFSFPNAAYAGSPSDYIVMVGNEKSNYTRYFDMVVLTSGKEIMLKANDICNILDFSYSYNKSKNKVIIKDKISENYLEYTVNSNNYVFYSSSSAKKIKKVSKYKCYYDSKLKTALIHYETINDLINCKYFKIDDNTTYGKGKYIFMSKYYSLDTLPNSAKQIPRYEVEGNTLKVTDFIGDTLYTKYTSYSIIDDIENSKGYLAKGLGMWFQIFILMGYNYSSVPYEVKCYLDSNGRIAFILPNGNIHTADQCYAILVANNIEDDAVREAFFYDKVDLKQLSDYFETYGPENVRYFIQTWNNAERKKQDAANKWIDNWYD